MEVCTLEWREHGPAFATPDGRLALSADYDSLFRKYLLRVQEETSLIPDEQEVESCYLTNRTPRKTAVTRLKRAGFADEFIDQINRWRAQEQSKGKG